MRIRVIDDDAEPCQLVADYLGPMRFAVESVHEGEPGAKAATSVSWQAIVFDVMLPDIDGCEVLRKECSSGRHKRRSSFSKKRHAKASNQEDLVLDALRISRIFVL